MTDTQNPQDMTTAAMPTDDQTPTAPAQETPAAEVPAMEAPAAEEPKAEETPMGETPVADPTKVQ